eukprot:9722061-Heterocapsa_arctica.AAC.1
MNKRARRTEKETRLRVEATSVYHQSLHLPFNPFCLHCAAKKKSQPARRRRDDPEDPTTPEQFGDLVSCDHVVLRQPDAGLDGERAGLQ